MKYPKTDFIYKGGTSEHPYVGTELAPYTVRPYFAPASW